MPQGEEGKRSSRLIQSLSPPNDDDDEITSQRTENERSTEAWNDENWLQAAEAGLAIDVLVPTCVQVLGNPRESQPRNTSLTSFYVSLPAPPPPVTKLTSSHTVNCRRRGRRQLRRRPTLPHLFVHSYFAHPLRQLLQLSHRSTSHVYASRSPQL